MKDLEKLILKHALKNAVEHNGKANPGVVLNKVLGEKPELRKDMKSLGRKIGEVLKEVNSMKPANQKKKLLVLWPSALEKKVEKPKELPELPNAVKGKVIVRVAPNVNGPLHIGHARLLILNDEYKKRYRGKLILRFDDTDPDVKRPMIKAYKWHLEDIKWLDIHPDVIAYASDRIPIYYEYAEKLIKADGAYTCSCSQEKSQEHRKKGTACPHREQPKEKSLKEFKDMIAGKYEKGEMVLKVKTDVKHPNPAVRDWVGLRIVRQAHPRVGGKYKVWPMLDFQSAVDDHLLGVTHILRGKELRPSTERQVYLYRHLGWKYPETKYWGRVAIEELGKLSKTDLAKEIEAGKYKGWDDPRLPTLMGLRKKGIKPEAIREFIVQMGFSEKDVKASLKILDAINRKYD